MSSRLKTGRGQRLKDTASASLRQTFAPSGSFGAAPSLSLDGSPAPLRRLQSDYFGADLELLGVWAEMSSVELCPPFHAAL